MGIAPGNARGRLLRAGLKAGGYRRHGKCHREYTASGAAR